MYRYQNKSMISYPIPPYIILPLNKNHSNITTQHIHKPNNHNNLHFIIDFNTCFSNSNFLVGGCNVNSDFLDTVATVVFVFSIPCAVWILANQNLENIHKKLIIFWLKVWQQYWLKLLLSKRSVKNDLFSEVYLASFPYIHILLYNDSLLKQVRKNNIHCWKQLIYLEIW